MNKEYKILKATTAKQAVEKAKNKIKEETSGKQLGLKTRWNSFNRANRKFIRLKQVILLAGNSGHGKSYLLTSIINDFLSPTINNNCAFKFIILYFSYEMSSEDDILRSAGIKMNISYNKILNSEWNKESQSYEGLNEEEFSTLNKYLFKMSNRPVFYFESAGNLKELYNTVAYYNSKYPNYKIVTAIDHTLLSKKEYEKSDIDLMANTGKTAIKLKKDFGSLVLMLGQFNNNIENEKRLNNPSSHFPIKSDIYAQSQLYNACDGVFTINQPYLLGLPLYTTKKIPTKNLIHLLMLKNRFGSIGSIWLKNNLSKGSIDEIDLNTLIKSNKMFDN